VTLAYVLIGVIVLGELPTMGQKREGSRPADRGSYAALTVLMAAGYWAAFYCAARYGRTFGVWASWLGASLTVGGTLFRQWAIRTLGAYFTRSVRVSADQRVVQGGPYRRVRHPSYAGAILAAAGVGLALGNALSLALLIAAVLPGFAYRILVEEKALGETLGEPYLAYRTRTKRLIPFIW
jgi:protein-S-isoprenylcysteine O-methyltransferase Ste14